ncbi:hypothetical protein [Paenibacillus medicaginis]|uniref:Uncharacterized protein n=1 Tax=Paenibacillus medicaginis TaxID=1470560 RepID=A0ABV5BUM2_9BACL
MENNHGQVGEALYLKFTSEKMQERCPNYKFENGQFLNAEELNKMPGVIAGVGVQIDDDTQGEYECVCEYGTEIWTQEIIDKWNNE